MSKDKQRGPHGISRRSFLTGAGAIAAATGLIRIPETTAEDTPRAEAGVRERLGRDSNPIELKVNGATHRIAVEPRVTLVRALREQLQLTGTKLACDRGSCGACTVLLDGRPVNSCMMLAVDARGHEIITVEGLGTPRSMHPVQSAFVENDATQCGFCTSGMIMAVAALLRSNPKPTLDDIKRATAGNICRCGTYPHVFAAALKAGRASRGARES